MFYDCMFNNVTFYQSVLNCEFIDCEFNDVRINMCSFQERSQLKFYSIKFDEFKIICGQQCKFNNVKFE